MHPERRREGRRIRTQRRKVARTTPGMLVIVDEVQQVDWDHVADVFSKGWTRLMEEFERAISQMAVWFTDRFFLAVCPDCKAGKHDACIGRAWDDTKDEEVDCSCSLVDHAPEVAEVAERVAAARSHLPPGRVTP